MEPWRQLINEEVAHHEAGHAVAVVLRRGRLLGIHFADSHLAADPTVIGNGATYHKTLGDENQAFVSFAGPFAQALWKLDNGPREYSDLDDALNEAWEWESIDIDPGSDAAQYRDQITRLGRSLVPLPRQWEKPWRGLILSNYPAIQEVAALTIANSLMVSHKMVSEVLERHGLL